MHKGGSLILVKQYCILVHSIQRPCFMMLGKSDFQDTTVFHTANGYFLKSCKDSAEVYYTGKQNDSGN